MGSLGVFVAAVYYILNIQNNRRNQELSLKAQQQNLDTRQAQLLMQVYQTMYDKEALRDNVHLLNMEWEDYNDFERKYGSDNNPENYAMRERMKNFYNSIGFLLKFGLVEAEKVYEIAGIGTIESWNKFGDIFLKQRKIYNMPEFALNYEYLFYEMVRMRKSRGYSTETSKMPLRYVPEK